MQVESLQSNAVMMKKTFFLCLLTLLIGGLLLHPAAPSMAGECNLSKIPGTTDACPPGAVGAGTPNKGWNGGRVEPKTDSKTAVDAYGYCRYVGNAGDKPEFIPFGDEDEWHSYLSNHPPSVYLIQCTRGGAIAVPPNFGKDGATNQCTGLPPLQNIIVPYKPANVPSSFTGPPITYNCTAADGTPFTETATATLEPHDSGYGPDPALGWTFSKILYDYNAVCGPAKGVASNAAPTSGLCSVGVASAVIGTGPYQWICSSGNGGGKNVTCSTGTPCEARKMDERPCQCNNGDCYRAVYWQDSCGHSWVDKSQKCDAPEPTFKPLPPIDYDNDHLSR